MPAKFIKTYKYTAPDGMQFDTLREEQRHELDALIPSDMPKAELLDVLLQNSVVIVAILKQKERKNASPSNRRPRKDKGGTHKKSVSVEAAA